MCKELFEQIERFQNLRLISPQTKTSSYQVGFHFDSDGTVDVTWGCYDIADYPRYYETCCKRSELVEHMKVEIDKMVEALEGHE